MNNQIEWFCCHAVDERLLTAAQCRLVARAFALNNQTEFELRDFVQSLIAEGFCTNVERLGKLAKLAAKEAETLGSPPKTVFADGNADAPPHKVQRVRPQQPTAAPAQPPAAPNAVHSGNALPPMDGQIEWFCYDAVNEKLLTTAHCRLVARSFALNQTRLELSSFVQVLIEEGYCKNVKRLEELARLAVQEAEARGLPPESVLRGDATDEPSSLKRKIRLRHFAPDADPCIDEDAPPRGDDDDPAVHAVVYTLPRRREEKALGCPATIGVIILVVVVPFVLFAMLQNSGGSSSSDGHSTGASTPAAVQQPAKPGSPAAAARSASDSPRHPASAVQQPTSAPAAQGRRAEAADLERQKAQQAAQDELARVQAAQQESLTSANEAINEANRLLEAGDLAGHFTKFDLSSNHIYNAYIVMITYWKERAKAGDPAAEVEMRASAKVLLDALDELEKSLWKAHKMLMSRCDEARESGDVDTGFRMIQLAQGRLKRMEVIRYHRSFAQEQLLMR